MKEQEVFDMFRTIDAKLDRIAECRIDDLKAINGALEKKADQDKIDATCKETKSVMKWMISGACAVFLVLFGYTLIMKSDISRLQTAVISLHKTAPAIETMVKENSGEQQ